MAGKPESLERAITVLSMLDFNESKTQLDIDDQTKTGILPILVGYPQEILTQAAEFWEWDQSQLAILMLTLAEIAKKDDEEISKNQIIVRELAKEPTLEMTSLLAELKEKHGAKLGEAVFLNAITQFLSVGFSLNSTKTEK